MEAFKYKNIDLKKRKQYMSDAWKLMFRRPLYSFVPFFIIAFLSILAVYAVPKFSIYLLILFGMFIVPIVSFEMSYSNEYSKIPFNNVDYIRSNGILNLIKHFKVEFFLVFFTCVFISYLETSKELKSSPEEIEPNIIMIIIFTIILTLSASSIFTYLYRIIFLFNNIYIPFLNKDIKQDEVLANMARKNEKQNLNKFVKCLFPISFICNLAYFYTTLFFNSVFLSSIIWGFFSAYGVALTYIISKDVCGEDTKLKEKKKIFDLSGGGKKVALES